VWLDGALIPEDDARISPQNRGFLYGDGCFETVRIHGGAPFRLDAHFERLRDGLEVLRIEPPWSVEDLRQGARKVVETNGVVEGLVRMTVVAGERSTTRGMATITTRALPEIPPQPALHVAAAVRRLSGPLSQVKSISRSAESVASERPRPRAHSMPSSSTNEATSSRRPRGTCSSSRAAPS